MSALLVIYTGIPHKFMAQDALNIICLLNGDRDSDGINGRLDEDFFLFVPADHHCCHQQLFTRSAQKRFKKYLNQYKTHNTFQHLL